MEIATGNVRVWFLYFLFIYFLGRVFFTITITPQWLEKNGQQLGSRPNDKKSAAFRTDFARKECITTTHDVSSLNLLKATTPAKAVCVTWIQILCWVQKDLGSFSCVVE